MKSHIRVLTLCAAAAAALVLGSCGGVNLLQELTTDVKTAKDMFLKVDSVEPANNTEEVNPDASVKIVFDRAVDMGTVSADTLTVSPTTGEGGAPLDISYVYNAATRTLTLAHGAYLATETLYTVTVTKGVRGEDASELKDVVACSFTTGLVPVGGIMINDGAAYQTDAAAVKLTMSYNAITDKMRFATYGDGWTDLSPGWQGIAPEVLGYAGFAPGDGEKTIYIQFRDDQTSTVSAIYHASIIRDTVDPVVEAGTLPQYFNAAAPTGSLNATVSDATSGIDTITWTKTFGPGTVTFGSASSADTTVSASADGAYTVKLTVYDKAGRSKSDTVNFTRDVTLPSVNTGADFYLNNATQTKSINATTSDAGTGISTRQWTKTSGPASSTVTFGTPAAEDTTVSADVDGPYVLTLTVTDVAGNTAADSVTVTRDIVFPSVNAGADFYLNFANQTKTINATTSDASPSSGIASRLWEKTVGAGAVTFGSPTAEDTTVNANTDTAYTLRLTVTDAAGNSNSDAVVVTRDIAVPSAASLWTDGIMNNAVPTRNLNATTADVGTGIASRLWSKYSGSGTITFGDASLEDTTVAASADGLYTLRLTVTDVAGNVTYSSLGVTRDAVVNTVNAGSTKYLPTTTSSVTMTATTADTVTGIASRAWTLTGTPAAGTLTITNGTTEDCTVSNANVAGTYTMTLTVTDVAGNSRFDTVSVICDPYTPTVDAGPTKYINTSGSVTMAATTSDTSLGNNYSSGWTRAWTYTGPTGGTLSFDHPGWEDPIVTAVSPIVDGTYTLTCTCIDSAGHSASDTVSVIVDTVAPSVEAGATKYLISPTLVIMTATTSDASPSSGIATRAWTHTIVANTLTITTPDIEDPSVSGFTDEGTDVLTLLVTDFAGNSASDTVTIVKDVTAPNPPTVTGTSPTTDTTPIWSWMTGGGGGSGTYRRKLDTGSWGTTTSTSYEPVSALTYGPHTLLVEERDLAGNWSADGTKIIYVSPPGHTPMWGATNVLRTTDVDWPTYSGVLSWEFYIRVAGGAYTKYLPETHLWSNPGSLAASTAFEWYYRALGSKGVLLYTSPVFVFMTGAH